LTGVIIPVLGALGVLVAAPLIVGLAVHKKSRRENSPAGQKRAVPRGGVAALRVGGAASTLQERLAVVEIYAFDGQIKSIDDIKSAGIGAYRDTGSVRGVFEDAPGYKSKILLDAKTSDEIQKILSRAAEVVRVSDRETLYFTASLRPLSPRTAPARDVYRFINESVEASKSILCRIMTVQENEDA